MQESVLAAVHIHRRSAAIAVFRGVHLEQVYTRHFESDLSKAQRSLTTFLRRTFGHTEIQSAAVETVLSTKHPRVYQLYKGGLQTLREDAISVWEVAPDDLLLAFGAPPLSRRGQLRTIAKTIWPVLNSKDYEQVALDASVLGLYVQAERLLNVPAKS
jgi:hypothetical protein